MKILALDQSTKVAAYAVMKDGKLLDLPINQEATTIYQKTFGFNDMIVGDVLLCDANQVE